MLEDFTYNSNFVHGTYYDEYNDIQYENIFKYYDEEDRKMLKQSSNYLREDE
jgi:hypothetical protein